MRIAIVTESFLPSLNGVTTSVCRVLDCLRERGHEAMVIAPSPAPTTYHGFPVRSVTSVPVRQFQVGLPTKEIEDLLADFRPDVVHVASPFFLGARGLFAARALGIPAVAIYQTDMAAYVLQHGGPAGRAASRATWRYLRWVHSMAERNLAPSSAAMADLRANGIGHTALWGRGVDTALFHPGWRDDAGCRALRRTLAPKGETIIGYVGRLAPEKELERLVSVADLPGTQLVLTGDGPSRRELAEALPRAAFLGRREGDDLARAYAACDVFVHTGTHETFGQTLQEAAATGLPVVAPARGGPLDLIDDGRTGLLFDPSDPADLRRCLSVLTVAEDAWEQRALMGEAGLARVANRSWRRLVDDLIGHYNAVRTPAHAA
ncbi:glycosyltransferase family 4 protein [Gephyromycinifex aptenodytis]|uniref:glycosyltransferase family 4 protein n=1 Tax=Gephyromycinifex aptenodytis TaxID=2716227 RepID=UPI0014489FA1|nr:glycosyltransferase family 1 protein [Gephyromycinifex aptenodytis]